MTGDETDLAISLINTGEALNRQDRLAEALDHQNQAVRILRRLVTQEDRRDLTHQLVLALCNRGLVARRMNNLLEALTSYDEAIHLLQSRFGNNLSEVEVADAATAFSGRGVVLELLGWKEESLERHGAAVDLYRQLVQRTEQPEYVNELARALMNRAGALFALERYAEALACNQEALDIRQKQVEQFGPEQFGGGLARALWGKAVALDRLGRSDEAVANYDSAITLCREMIRQLPLTLGLGGILLDKAKALRQQKRWEAALECCGEAVALYESQLNNGGRSFLADLLEALRVHFDLLRLQNDWQQAARDVIRLLDLARPILTGEVVAENASAELDRFAEQLRQLSDHEETQIHSQLGMREPEIRSLLTRLS